MSFFVPSHRSSRFAAGRVSPLHAAPTSHRAHSALRFCGVPGVRATTYGSRYRSAVPAQSPAATPRAADRACHRPAPHSALVTTSASCTASAMLLALSFRAAPMSRPCQYQAFKRYNTPLKTAPFGRSDAPQAARRLAARSAS